MPSIGAIGSSGSMSAVYQQAYYAAKISAARTAAANPAQPETPVEPVDAVRRVAPDAAVRQPVAVQEPSLPTVDDLNNASDNLARMRVQYAEQAEPVDARTEEQAAEEEVNTNFTTPAGIS